MKLINIFIVIVLNICFLLCEGGLTINGIECGQRFCVYGDYCSEIDRICRPCSNICNKSSHNFEEQLCIKDCQDYLHDIRYVQIKSNNDLSENVNLKVTVQKLSHMVTINLTLVCFMLIILTIVLLIQLYKWKKKKNITWTIIKNKIFKKESDSSPNKTSTSNTTTIQNHGKSDLRLDIPSPSNQSDSPITTTTSISRRPAEDNTLDYAYDNPAMATPSPHGKINVSF